MSRQQQREQFLARQGFQNTRITALVPDASARRYFRIEHSGDTTMLMDAPPPGEKPAEFIQVTDYLKQLGARVPRIVASDPEQGFILLEDLGDRTMTRLLADGDEAALLYHHAVDALVTMQKAFLSGDGKMTLPPYDLQATLTEAELMVRWYLPARLKRKIEASERDEFRSLWTNLYYSLPEVPQVLVHRDYHVDNLLIIEGECAMLDYQDALLGSPLYDLVSLLEDARRDVDPALRRILIDRWRQQIELDSDTFNRHYIFWGAQRHFKVAGIFVRLWLRDNKSSYLKHLPRVMRLLEHNLAAPDMAPLRYWLLDRLPAITHEALDEDPDHLRGFIEN